MAKNISANNMTTKHIKKNMSFSQQYIKNTIKAQDIINKSPNHVIDIALHYLEHGDLTDKQRYYLQRIASITSQQYNCFMFCMIFLVVITFICSICGRFVDEEMAKRMFECWLALSSTDLTIGFYKTTVLPIYYINKLNRASR